MCEIPPENIVMVARAGSYIYNLSTPESDIDYIIIYKEATKVPTLYYKLAFFEVCWWHNKLVFEYSVLTYSP